MDNERGDGIIVTAAVIMVILMVGVGMHIYREVSYIPDAKAETISQQEQQHKEEVSEGAILTSDEVKKKVRHRHIVEDEAVLQQRASDAIVVLMDRIPPDRYDAVRKDAEKLFTRELYEAQFMSHIDVKGEPLHKIDKVKVHRISGKPESNRIDVRVDVESKFKGKMMKQSFNVHMIRDEGVLKVSDYSKVVKNG